MSEEATEKGWGWETRKRKTSNWGLLEKGMVHGQFDEGREGRRLVTYKFLKRRGRTAWEARVSGRCRKAACAPRARLAQGLADKGAGAGCGLGEGCGAEGVGVHYV